MPIHFIKQIAKSVLSCEIPANQSIISKLESEPEQWIPKYLFAGPESGTANSDRVMYDFKNCINPGWLRGLHYFCNEN
jgi:hypothetical protein